MAQEENKIYVPNDVFEASVTLCLSKDIDIYVDPLSVRKTRYGKLNDEAEEQVKKAYFTKERINELKEEFIMRIMTNENPFSIRCEYDDSDWNVTERELFNIKK